MLFINDKIEETIKLLRELQPTEGYYLAFSGGKDSQCAYHLLKLSGVKFDSHMMLTSVDPKELLMFVKNEYPDVIMHRPEKTMWELIEQKRMPPTRIVRYCCEYLKERGGEGRFVITGIRSAESYKRSKRRQIEFCVKKNKRFLHPCFHFSDEEVWYFLNEIVRVRHCCLYDQGFNRIGCIGCPMIGSKRQLIEFNRLPQYKQAYINAFKKMVDNRIADGLETQWKTGEEVFEWWTTEKKDVKEDSDDCQINMIFDS